MVLRLVIRHNRQMFNSDGSKDGDMVASACLFLKMVIMMMIKYIRQLFSGSMSIVFGCHLSVRASTHNYFNICYFDLF